jgi:SAM-dependent methyltransferase
MRVSDATNYGNEADGSVDYEYDDAEAKSQFGTKEYWDEQYQGRGDFPMDEYQWYFGFEQYGKCVQSYAPSKDKEILIPGIGNDPILLDLLQKGYTKLTATDYSEFAIERQIDFLAHGRYPFLTNLHSEEDGTSMQQCSDDEGQRPTELLHMDARKMPAQWANKFDAIVEKGALDAIYLSGNGNVELAAREFERILKPGGILITVSGVVPVDLRKEIFRDWTWIRDGSEDLKAGCFILEKPIS